MERVLVLNSDYTPVNVTNITRAIKLIIKEKAEILKEGDETLRSEKISFKAPLVIRLLNYVKIKLFKVVLTKRNILVRDGFKCVYCGSKDKLTLDHLIPKSKGGRNDWNNLVTCCDTCNKKKGDKTPEEAGMVLLDKPSKPNYYTFLKKYLERNITDWEPYLFH
jgi:5-methylcytosine-specific restriction endonuclease McrA